MLETRPAWYRLACLLLCTASFAAAAEHGATLREGQIYMSPDTSSQKLVNFTRGREVAVLERSGKFIHVLATIDVNPDLETSRDISGWMLARNVVSQSTPDGDKLLFGEAIDSEAEASRRHGRKGAAADARRLYYRVYDLFPTSPIAGEALYRSADIQWQLEKEDASTRPSSKSDDPNMRAQIDEQNMKLVIKKFPHTKWSDLAAFHFIDNKICGDWMGQSKCPLKEAELYEKYAQEYPNSPAAAEALYDAAYRYAALVDIYRTEEKSDKASDAGRRATSLAQQVVQKAPNTDWSMRALRLVYMVQNNIPVFGTNYD
jgi:outer membrane protein assembly factor BamD (BamD/ComL family)